MPKRTKREKMIRSLRRRVIALEEKPFVYEKPEKVKALKKKAVPENIRSEPVANSLDKSGKEKTAHIKKDLLKTFVLSVLAITVELVLYFVGKRG